jgi:hypothetical protein
MHGREYSGFYLAMQHAFAIGLMICFVIFQQMWNNQGSKKNSLQGFLRRNYGFIFESAI